MSRQTRPVQATLNHDCRQGIHPMSFDITQEINMGTDTGMDLMRSILAQEPSLAPCGFHVRNWETETLEEARARLLTPELSPAV
jgi:hypothetical protein